MFRNGDVVTDVADHGGAKPATAARIYDYQLGGTHNFPADREAAMAMNAMFPQLPAMSRAYRAWLGRAVRYLAGQGVRQIPGRRLRHPDRGQRARDRAVDRA